MASRRRFVVASLAVTLSITLSSTGCYDHIAEPTTGQDMDPSATVVARDEDSAADAGNTGTRAPAPRDAGPETVPTVPATPRDAGAKPVPPRPSADASPPEDPALPPPWSDGVAVDAGESHTCAVKHDGSLWCWGANFYGQLGHGAADSKTCLVNNFALPCDQVPRRVGDAHDWSGVSAGHTHTCAIRQNGTLFCWGRNLNGALGDGTTDSSSSPLQVGANDDWIQVTAGEDHTCGIRAGGELYCWGRNDDDELGTTEGVAMCGESTCSLTPLRVGPELDWSFLSAGGQTTCAIRGGALHCWGSSYVSQASEPDCWDAQACLEGVVRVGVDSDWASVSTWASHTCAIKTDGSLWCWGATSPDDPTTRITAPQRVAGGRTFLHVATGEHYTCAVATDGSLYCWGSNDLGQIGDGRKGEASCFGSPCAPEPVQVGSAFAAITTGLQHTCGLKADGTLFCWGASEQGQVGALNLESCELPGLGSTPCATRPWPVDPGD